MQDDSQNKDGQQIEQQQQDTQSPQPQEGILNQTFGEVLQNKEAQERIMKAMHISPEQFQQLLKSTEGNPLTNMTVGQMFNSGFIQKAVQAQGGKMPSMEQIPQQQVSDETVDQQQAVDQSVEEDTSASAEQEIDQEQMNQLVQSENAQVLETDEMGNPTKIAVQQEQPDPEPQKQSWWDIVKSAFK